MKKKPNKLNFVVNTGVYPVDIMVSLGETDIEFERKLRRFTYIKDHQVKMKGSGRCVFLDNGACYIRLWNYPERSSDFGSLSHEILHAVFAVLGYVGVKFEDNISEEAFTYLIGYLTNQIYKKLGF